MSRNGPNSLSRRREAMFSQVVARIARRPSVRPIDDEQDAEREQPWAEPQVDCERPVAANAACAANSASHATNTAACTWMRGWRRSCRLASARNKPARTRPCHQDSEQRRRHEHASGSCRLREARRVGQCCRHRAPRNGATVGQDHTLINVLNTRACRREISISGPPRSWTCSWPLVPGSTVLDELDVDDLAAVGAEEALRVEPLLQAAERTSEQRPNLAPVQAHVVALRDDQAHLVQRHEPAARAVADEQPLDDLRLARGALRRRGPRARASAPARRSGSMGLSR